MATSSITLAVPTTLHTRIEALRLKEDTALWKPIDRAISMLENNEDTYADHCNQTAYIVSLMLKKHNIEYDIDSLYEEVLDLIEK